MIGLLSVSLGFVMQLWDNLVVRHKLDSNKIFLFLVIAFVYLVFFVLYS